MQVIQPRDALWSVGRSDVRLAVRPKLWTMGARKGGGDLWGHHNFISSRLASGPVVAALLPEGYLQNYSVTTSLQQLGMELIAQMNGES